VAAHSHGFVLVVAGAYAAVKCQGTGNPGMPGSGWIARTLMNSRPLLEQAGR
jgi:hypothetical protein